MRSKSIPTDTPTPDEVKAVIDEAELALAQNAGASPSEAVGHPPSPQDESAPPSRSTRREAAVTAVGIAGGEAARRAAFDALDRNKVIDVARRVATKKTAGMTDAQVVHFIADNAGFRKSLAGHLHEVLDAEDLKFIYDLRSKCGLSEGRFLQLYAEHNRKGLDGAYKGATKAGEALFAQHKLTENPAQMRKAASKVGPRLRGKTELVVGRGMKDKAAEQAAKGLKGVRETGRSVAEINGIVQKAADPKRATRAGTKAAGQLTLKAGAGAAALGAGVSVACDVNKVRKGELTISEATENAAWAGGEAALCTAAAAGATMAAAPAIAAGTAALAASTAAGTTAMAAGLVALGPVGVGIGASICIGVGVKKARTRLRDQ